MRDKLPTQQSKQLTQLQFKQRLMHNALSKQQMMPHERLQLQDSLQTVADDQKIPGLINVPRSEWLPRRQLRIRQLLNKWQRKARQKLNSVKHGEFTIQLSAIVARRQIRSLLDVLRRILSQKNLEVPNM
jgi:hypothetical protein